MRKVEMEKEKETEKKTVRERAAEAYRRVRDQAAEAGSPGSGDSFRVGGKVVDEFALTAAHKAVEDVLVEMRDARMGVIGPANGFVIKERNGETSEVIRLGTHDGLRIGIRAYLDAVGAG